MWPKLTQCYNVQDVGSVQSGNNLLGLIKAAQSQVSWADLCKMKMIFLRNQKSECTTHHSNSQFADYSSSTGPTVTWMFEPSYCKVQRCHVWLCKVRLLRQKNLVRFLWCTSSATKRSNVTSGGCKGSCFRCCRGVTSKFRTVSPGSIKIINPTNLWFVPGQYIIHQSHNLVMFSLLVDQVSWEGSLLHGQKCGSLKQGKVFNWSL